MQAFTRRHVPRATCVVHPRKAQNHVRRMGLSTLKIWCECTAQFSRQTPESSTDRQTDRQREGRQKMPSPQYKSPKYKELSYAKAYELSFVFLRFWINPMGLHGENEVKSRWCRPPPPDRSRSVANVPDVTSGKMGSYLREDGQLRRSPL